MKSALLLVCLMLSFNVFAVYEADIVEGQVLTEELAREMGMEPLESELVDAEEGDASSLIDLSDNFKSFEDKEEGWRSGPDHMKAEVVLIIDKAAKGTSETAQTMDVYYKGDLLHTFKVSTGKETIVTATNGKRYRATTPLGYYRPDSVWKRYQSSLWVGADMDFAIFFTGGIAIHSTVEKYYPKLGSRASGGCVRVHRDHAEIVNELVLGTGEGNYEVKEFNRRVNGRTVERHRAMGNTKRVLGVYRRTGIIYNETTERSWDTLIVVKDSSK